MRGFDAPEFWPCTGNPERVESGLLHWKDAVHRLVPGPDRDFAEAFSGSPAGKAMLATIFGASPFLGQCVVRDPGYVRALWERGPDRCVDDTIAQLQALPLNAGQGSVSRSLRLARRKVALAVGLADIARVWDLEAVTSALTRFAETACSVAFRQLLTELSYRGALDLADPEDPERDSGLIALGLGKLGGCELNYSSDIDLILLYDPAAVPRDRRHEIPSTLIKLARSFVAMLAELTADGRVFPVDLRLRPDPVSMPLVVSTESALRYYEQRGQTWERAALIKARPIAGDTNAANAFLDRLKSFVWRPDLDFATVQDLHGIKKRIDTQHRGGKIGVPGQNLKLGRGGIREIEFFAQAHQLVWGGTDHSLRMPATCAALRVLAESGRIQVKASQALTAAYTYLRGVEHRIQMVADKQTHSLPTDPGELETLARFLGHSSTAGFTQDLERHLRQVEQQYESFFELPREMTEASASTTLSYGSASESVSRLERMGFRDAGRAFEIIEKWRTGRCLAARDTRALRLLQALTPSLVIAMCGTQDPDLAIDRFDRMIDRIPDGYRAFTLFQANLHVMETVAEIMVAAPKIGAMLTARPSLLEVLLDPRTDSAPPGRTALEASVATLVLDEGQYGDAVDRLREWVETSRFRVGVQVLFRSLDPLDAPPLLSDVADCAVSVLLRRAEAELADKHERLEGSGTAVVATDRFGKRALSFDSGVEIEFLHVAPQGRSADDPDGNSAANFGCEIEALVLSGLRGRPGQRQIYACMAASRAIEGVSLQDVVPATESAGRARLVACTAGITERAKEAIGKAVSAPRSPDTLGERIAAMRNKTRAESARPQAWNVDQRPGGLVDIELLTDYLWSRDTPHTETSEARTTGEALAALARKDAISPEDATCLIDGWELWTRILALQHLSGTNRDGDNVPERLRPLFQAAAGTESFDGVLLRMDVAADAVSAVCDRLLPHQDRDAARVTPEE